jgi:hypothetical protein
MTTAVDVAERVAFHAEEIASLMAIYQTSASMRTSAVRADLLVEAEAHMTQLSDVWLRFVLHHKTEALEAKL